MRRAIELSRDALGRTAPNPMVGCVVLDADGVEAGAGAHRGAGTRHAETIALASAGARATGGTAVVTLEPCRHTGRTGPCTDALLGAGIARVVYAVPDPDPVAAGGAAVLRAAGVEVVGGLLREEAERANEMWLTAVRHRRPFVTWKFASTLDGRTAAADGSSRWITAREARRDGHALRAEHDAVLVGTGTLRADDPDLGLRHGVVGRPPLRVVLDASGRVLSSEHRVLRGPARTLVATAADLPVPSLPHRAEALPTPRANGRLDLGALLGLLYERDVRGLLVEGGATVAAGFVAAGLVDRVVAYLAPALLGAGREVLAPVGVTGIGEAVRLRIDSVAMVGDDVRLEMRPRGGRGRGEETGDG
ncbi:bifunctional diaminohydroxyphosphoribosylaminopyrimidine deaminase/5-amino-6-(5-phosphoribosylamino)uracil reductase RibD [Spirillospora sp. NPDC127200]